MISRSNFLSLLTKMSFFSMHLFCKPSRSPESKLCCLIYAQYNLKTLLAGQMLPSGTTVKDKALLSNPPLIYLPPCSLGPTMGLERNLVLA